MLKVEDVGSLKLSLLTAGIKELYNIQNVFVKLKCWIEKFYLIPR
jgi:hypothetical protein